MVTEGFTEEAPLRVDLKSPHKKEYSRYREEKVPSKAQGWQFLKKDKDQGPEHDKPESLFPHPNPTPSHLLQVSSPLSWAPGFSQPPDQQKML